MVIHSLFMAQIQTFLMVAETLNFRRAAERLAVAQPALSRSVRRLEQHLGFPSSKDRPVESLLHRRVNCSIARARMLCNAYRELARERSALPRVSAEVSWKDIRIESLIPKSRDLAEIPAGLGGGRHSDDRSRPTPPAACGMLVAHSVSAMKKSYCA
jgi:hypothetical protein